MGKSIRDVLKVILGIPQSGSISLESFVHYTRLRYGKCIFKQRYSAGDIVDAMIQLGIKKGDTLMIHCSWDEFYNCDSTPKDLINEILRVIGPEGTLCMPAYPLKRKGKLFDVRRTRTTCGMLAEVFRSYPGVKRSIHTNHSVCAIGPLSDFLLSEHHLGETSCDEKSPFYKLATINSSLYTFGLGKYWEGTIMHCVESILRRDFSYYNDLFYSKKSEFQYIDYDGEVKSYFNYDLKGDGIHSRRIGYLKNRRIVKKYLNANYINVSNLQVAKYDIPHVVKTLISLGRKGKDAYIFPLKTGYKFDK